MIVAWHRSNGACRRLDDNPGVGPALATALVASVPDPKIFCSGRAFAASIGLVPNQSSSGGKERLGGATGCGDRCVLYSHRSDFRSGDPMLRLTAEIGTKQTSVATLADVCFQGQSRQCDEAGATSAFDPQPTFTLWL